MSLNTPCGVGSTMTAADVLNGQLIAVVKVAVEHPAEFATFTIRQEMTADGPKPESTRLPAPVRWPPR